MSEDWAMFAGLPSEMQAVVAIGFFATVVAVTSGVFKAWKHLLMFISVNVNGHPPMHCDALGDFKKEEKDDDDDDDVDDDDD